MFNLNNYIIFLFILINIVAALFEKECENDPFKDYVSHPNFCEKYIYCTGTEGLEGECPNGDYFDELTGTCNRPENVNCVNKPIEEITTELPTTESTSTSTSTSETETTPTLNNTTPIQTIESCPAEDNPNEIVYLKSPTSQSEYFICYHGNPMLMSCTDKLYFNLLSKTCELIENNTEQNSTPSLSDCTENKNVFYPHPTKCEFFYYCLNGYMTLQQCPLLYQWDVNKQSCLLPNEAKCHIEN